MNVVVSGSTGLVGTALAAHLAARGHRVIRLVRGRPARGSDEIGWDPGAGRLDRADLAGVDAAVHLSGESIAAGRWNAARKGRIRASRVESTRLLARTFAGLSEPPRALVQMSAIGYYGDRGAEALRETSPPGSGFLADLCRDWEAAAEAAVARGIRVVALRAGIVLSARGGALAQMLPVFRLGLGGRLGSGRQYMSWIALEDLVRVIEHALQHDDLIGAVNAVAPSPVTNAEFTATLGRVLRRPAMLPVPGFALRLLFGELGRELLASGRVLPERLLESGYAFQLPELEGALRRALANPRGSPP